MDITIGLIFVLILIVIAVMKNPFYTIEVNATNISAVFTVIAVIMALAMFISNIEMQKEKELESHISNMESLLIEYEKNLEGIKLVDELITETNFTIVQFITENLKERVADGNIKNKLIKTILIVRLNDISALNNEIMLFNNRLESIFENLDNQFWTIRRDVGVPRIKNSTNKLIRVLPKDINIINEYILCINTTKDINKCENNPCMIGNPTNEE